MAKRPRQPVPSEVSDALKKCRLITAYQQRPAYQRNDYVSWIIQAKRDETRRGRIDQMLAELRRGDVYMKMPWHGRDRAD